MIFLLSIAIVDDEMIIRDKIKKILEKKDKNAIVDTFSSGKDLLSSAKFYDIVFLDIKMDEINGIDTAKRLRKKSEDIIIIFITGLKEYVFEAFDVSAFHYLVKPIDEHKFLMIYERAVTEVKKQSKSSSQTLFIKTRKRNVTLKQSDILYIESRAKKVEIHTKTDIIDVYAAISELEKRLHGSFYRCHRGYLVNMRFISEYSNNSITLNNGEKVILAKEKYGEFVKTYMRYLKNGGGIFV